MQRLMSLVAASVLLWGLADTHGLAIEQQPDQETLEADPAARGETAGTLIAVTDPAAEEEVAGTLTVVTDPAGATVYVAGRPRGETPVEVAGLPAGDHRVTIVKDGYIPNSRVLALGPNEAERLSVELTAAAAGGSALQEDSEEGGGGGWWKWAALAGGGGAAAYLLLPKNKPPVAGLSITPTGSGMAGATSYRFNGGSSSDPDGDQLTYSWNFGDGSSGSGVNASHVYDSPGTYSVTLTVSDGKESATATGSATVARNLDGGVFVSQNLIVTEGGETVARFRETIRLTQNGATLRGSSRSDGTITGTVSVSGSVSSSRDFVCPCDVRLSGSGGYVFSGTVDNGAGRLRGDLSFRLNTNTPRGVVTIRFRGVIFTRQ